MCRITAVEDTAFNIKVVTLTQTGAVRCTRLGNKHETASKAIHHKLSNQRLGNRSIKRKLAFLEITISQSIGFLLG